MKHINKQNEPLSLLQHRKKEHADYDNYKEKDDLRKALLEEQGYICCYCMQQIFMETMKIEHWKPQTTYPELQLDYNNLIAACKGNEGNPIKDHHCDTAKKDREIIINPVDAVKNCEKYIRYNRNGRIGSYDLTINEDLNKTLNLNHAIIIKNRKTVIDHWTTILCNKQKHTWKIQDIKKVINILENKTDKKYQPYCQAVIYLLKKRIGSL